ncbi:MAG: (2Fe-2S) ferredoxin domain-containing protein [Spirochaetaceae bacterium]|nr:(2Fe-2S) ferredoxin domain-containing protein [Spirochaetaceae bacterium]
MSKMTLEDLRKLRETKKLEASQRDTDGKETLVIVGMGTCGIAAGAKEVLDVMLGELKKVGNDNVIIRQAGCMGLCHVEPTVEVRTPGMPDTIYGKVDATVAQKIVHQHIVDGHLVNKHVYDKPAADIIKQ